MPVGIETKVSAAGVGEGRVSGTGVAPGVGVEVPVGTMPTPTLQNPGVGATVGVVSGVGTSVGTGLGEPPPPPHATKSAQVALSAISAGRKRALELFTAALFVSARASSLRAYWAAGRFGSPRTSAIAR